MKDCKRLPDSIGFWVSDDGQECYITPCKFSVEYKISTRDGCNYRYAGTIADAVREVGLTPARWLKVERPEFPQRPPKPTLLQCYVKAPGSPFPVWRVFREGAHTSLDGGSDVSEYTVAPHPDNDPDAVKMIEEAHTHAS